MATETLDFPVWQKGENAAAEETKTVETQQLNAAKATDFELTQAAAKGDMVAFEEV